MSPWKDKIVVVTGASAGLGFTIAQSFAKRGAHPVLIGRDRQRLETACSELSRSDASCDSVVADVTNLDDCRKAFEAIVSRWGHIDALINNVGKSIRTDILQTTSEEYRELMETNFFSAVHCTQFALPELAKTSGHLVNIGSLSSKTAWPFLGPYTTSKFALAGYTQQLRLEGPANVHYLLVCPGPIDRGDAGQRYQKQVDTLPASAQEPAAGAKLKRISATALAEKIVRYCERRKPELVVPARTRLLFTLASLSPRWGDWLLRRLIK